jgi:cobalt/nickel transport system permease protein
MLEWLQGDPLVGILTTIGFFVFLIIGRELKLRRMQKPKKVAAATEEKVDVVVPQPVELDARIKLVIAVTAIFGVVFMVHWQTTLIVLATSIALVFYSHASMRSYLKRLLYPSYIIILVAVIQPFTYGSTVAAIVPGLGLPIYQEGIAFGVLVFTRALAAVSVLNLLILVTPMETIMDSLRWFRVPDVILDTMMLMYRYIAIVSEESARMRKAQESRLGYSKAVSFPRKLANFGTLAGMLLTRAFDRAVKVGDAMIARGYTGASSLFTYSTGKLRHRDTLAGLITVLTIIVLVLLDVLVL